MRKPVASTVVVISLATGATLAQTVATDATTAPTGTDKTAAGEAAQPKIQEPIPKGEASGAPGARRPDQYTVDEIEQAKAARRKEMSDQNSAGQLPKGGER